MEHRVTIKEIAAEAGVSTGTVHRALYGKKGLSEQTRQQILDLCARRGYRANSAGVRAQAQRAAHRGRVSRPTGRKLLFLRQRVARVSPLHGRAGRLQSGSFGAALLSRHRARPGRNAERLL